MKIDFTQLTVHEMANRAEAGTAGAGSMVEMTSRLTGTIRKSGDTIERLNRCLLWFTIALFVFTAVQLGVTVGPLWRQWQ